MWPRHFMKHDFPQARVMIYGHRSALTGTNTGQVLDYSREFARVLKLARRDVSSNSLSG